MSSDPDASVPNDDFDLPDDFPEADPENEPAGGAPPEGPGPSWNTVSTPEPSRQPILLFEISVRVDPLALSREQDCAEIKARRDRTTGPNTDELAASIVRQLLKLAPHLYDAAKNS